MIATLRFALAAGLLLAAIQPAARAINPLLKEFEEAFIQLGEHVGPSVVEITAETNAPGDAGAMEELFRFFDSPEDSPEGDPEGDSEGDPQEEAPQLPNRRPPTATGSGFVFDSLGHVVTNNHVVENAKSITVEFQDGTKREAKIVGRDEDSDLAVIKVDAAGLTLSPVTLGNSDALRVGQFAIAMGSPRGLTRSISFGHVSGLGREDLTLPGDRLRFQGFIQTDAAINLGNSGGPLLNIDGEVIGVNIAIVFGANSIGFAIPVNRVKEIVPQLIAGGKVVRGWLGVSILEVAQAAEQAGQTLNDYIDAYGLEDGNGASVQALTWEGPAEKAQLQKDDVIWKINDVIVKDRRDLIDRISHVAPGTVVQLKVWRGGELTEIPVEVAEFPGMDGAQYGRSYLGMHLMDLKDVNPAFLERMELPEDTTGVVIPAIVPGGPAEEADIQPSDVIVKVDQKPVQDRQSFKLLVKENAEPGKTLLLHILRPGNKEEQRKFVKVPENFHMD